MKKTIVALIAVLSLGGTALAQKEKSGDALSDYVGRYGNKEITVQDGTLHYQRLGGRGATLRAMGTDIFALNEDATITFKRDAKSKVVEMAIDWVAHEDEQLKREPLGSSPTSETGEPTGRRRVPDQSLAGKAIAPATLEQLKVIITHLLETIYVSPEVGSQLARQLRQKFEAGSYMKAASSSQLAGMLTNDLRDWAHDRHLNVRFNPEMSPEPEILNPETWEKQRPEMFPREDAGSGARMSGPLRNDRMAAQLQSDNFQFHQSRMTDGEIGYLELTGFAPGEEAQKKAAEIMATLSQSKAFILDLRECKGGAVEMVNFLASYFFDDQPRVLMNRYVRPTNERFESKTLAEIPGQRMPVIDLYILVSARTASAGESFAYTMQQYGRAKIIGETTAGAGYNNVILPLGQGFVFSISYGRPEHPRTGKGWEGVGVQPDIPVPAEQALVTARKLALQNLIGLKGEEIRPSAAGVEPMVENAERKVRELERAWLDAYEHNDAEAMEKILADDFSISFGDGRKQTKAQVLLMVKQMKDSVGPGPIKFFTYGVEARVEGEEVMLTGTLSQTSEGAGATAALYKYTDTYKKRAGRWQVVTSRVTAL